MYIKKMFSLHENKSYISGSKVPVSELTDYLNCGKSIFDFLDDYPWLKIKDIKKSIEAFKNNADFSTPLTPNP